MGVAALVAPGRSGSLDAATRCHARPSGRTVRSMETDDLAAWYRADQQAARETYAAADSATLVALLGVLDNEIETGKQALATWQRSLSEGRDADAVMEARRNEAVDALRSRVEVDPAWQQLADEVESTLGSAIDEVRARSEASGRSLVDVVFVQTLSLTGRRRLVRDELERRGLLAAFPH